MTDMLKILGQVIPTSNILTLVYVVPSVTQTTISSIVVCNQSGLAASFRISVAKGGVVDDAKQYLYYDLYLDSNDTFTATIGISLSATDEIRVQSSTGLVSFNIFGVELV